MNNPVVNLPPPESPPPGSLSLDAIFSAAWECAVESFVRTILVVVFGNIAIGIASSIWEEMLPSPPPGFEHKPEAEAVAPGPGSVGSKWFGDHVFLVTFCLIFLLTLWFRLGKRSPAGLPGKLHPHLARITNDVSQNWFSLVVGNAFGALLSAIIVVWVQQFTLVNLIWHWLLGSLLSVAQNLAHYFVGAGTANTAAVWFHWYGDNQLKFTFWFFYLSAICDDLGLPNFKTLGRRLARRILKGRKPAQALP